MVDWRNKPWHQVDIDEIDVFRDNDIDSLTNYVGKHKEKSLNFAHEVFNNHEEENYAKAIMIMRMYKISHVPNGVLKLCFEKNDVSTREALHYFKAFPEQSLEDDLINYVKRIVNSQDGERFRIRVGTAIKALALINTTPNICQFFKEIAKSKNPIFQKMGGVRDAVKQTLSNMRNQPSYPANTHKHAV